MDAVVCTLFEKHYHYGVAVLTNSLYSSGFRGNIYAGYRGILPSWANNAKENTTVEWTGCKTMQLLNGLQLHFLPLDTNYHLTNYKPDFMLKLWQSAAKHADYIFYFDPDIVITASWNYFTEWAASGVALNEDVNSPLSQNHPRRIAWRRYFGQNEIQLKFKDAIYVNGGFAGVHIKNQSFLHVWQTLQEVMAPAIGGLERSAFSGNQISESGPFTPFGKTDQDALNASIEAWDGVVSLVGKSGMAFTIDNGFFLMPHALGQVKPWILKPLSRAFAGRSIRVVDKAYWKHVNGLIRPFSKSKVLLQRIAIKMAMFINHFYK